MTALHGVFDIHSCSYFCERPSCIRAQRDEMRRMLDACAIYLKDGETPAECILRNRADMLAMTEQYGKLKAEFEQLKETWTDRQWTEYERHLLRIEREACAKLAEAYEPRCDACPSGVANAIRARGETK